MGVAFKGFAREGENKLKTLLEHLAAQPRPTHSLAVFR
jgi:hypothetical protein